MQNMINELFNKKEGFTQDDFELFSNFKKGLMNGSIRAANKIDGEWITNIWVKKGILLGFRMGKIIQFNSAEKQIFTDKDTYNIQNFLPEHRIRLVPGGSSVREGAYIAQGVTMMPPMYINVGAYVDSGSLIDSHALVGSCAQIGKNVHLSAGAMIGGVIEPIGANPVIIEDNVFVGGNSGIYEGVIVKESAIIAAGVIITAGTKIFDATKNEYLKKEIGKPVIIPAKAVVISGTRPLKSNPDFSVYCPIIIKYRDAKSDLSTTLETEIR